MVNKPKIQGTDWEGEVRDRARDKGMVSNRLAEEGINDPGDVWINAMPHSAFDDVPVLAWKRLNGDGKRRTPDGIRDVVVMRTDDFLDLAKANPDRGFVVECKARQNLNVTRTLAKTIDKLNKWKAKR